MVSHGGLGSVRLYDQLLERITPEVKREWAHLKEKNRIADEQWAAKERARTEALHQANERKRKIGSRICKEARGDYGPLVYAGFVEDLSPEKIQIRVSTAFYKGSPSNSPGGFRESIIWDYPRNWTVCE